MEQSTETTLLNGALMLSAATYIGYQLKGVPPLIWQYVRRKLLFTMTIEETDELYFYLERFMKENYSSQYRNVQATIANKSVLQEENEPMESTIEEEDKRAPTDKLHVWQHEDYFIIRYGKQRKRLVITKGREKLEAAKDLFSAYFNRFTIRGLFAKQVILELLEDAIEYNQQFKQKNPPQKWVSDQYGHWQKAGFLKTKTLDKIVLAEKDKLLRDVSDFLGSRKWYQDRSIPYKRGYLFYGKPGNGKTATCLGLATELKRDIYFITLNQLANDNALRQCFLKLKENAIIVFEDVDALYSDRKMEDGSREGVSFSTLLNCLDGAFSREDTITIMTTNHKDKLDAALIRAGRVDMHLEISNPSKREVEEYTQIFFDDISIKLDSYKSGSLPMVDIQDICLRNKTSVEDVLKEIEQS